MKRLARNTILLAACLFVLSGFYVLAFGRVVLNGSHSLPHTAYMMFTWPRVPLMGSYAAAELPDVLKGKFEGLVIVKKVVGFPGDQITRHGRQICISDICASGLSTGKGAKLDLWQADSVPSGQLALMGATADSLDSRYDLIGGFEQTSVIAVGFPIPLPNWKVMKSWLEK